MCRALGIPIPFLPVSGRNEYRLFTSLVHQLSGFDDEKWQSNGANMLMGC
jgi:hypothetical protein